MGSAMGISHLDGREGIWRGIECGLTNRQGGEFDEPTWGMIDWVERQKDWVRSAVGYGQRPALMLVWSGLLAFEDDEKYVLGIG